MTHGLAIGDLRPAHVRVDLELAREAVDDDLEVQLAHAGDDGLTGLFVGAHAEGGVLLGELHQRGRQLLFVGLRLGLDGDEDHRLGELHRLEDDGLGRVCEGVTGPSHLEADGGRELARVDLVAVLAVVGVHLQDAADALALVLARIEDVGARLEGAGVHAEVGQLADVWVGGDLEGEGREGVAVVGPAVHLVPVGPQPGDRRHVERRRQVLDDGVHERLHAFVLEARAAEDRRDADIERRLADDLTQVIDGDLAALQVGLEQMIVVIGHGLDQLLAVLVRQGAQLGRDLGDLPVGAQLIDVDDGVHLDEVDDAGELALLADGHLQGDGIRAQAVDHHLEAAEEVGADAVHLVDEGDARDAVLVGLAPHGLGLRLDAAHAAEQRDGAVQHAKAALDLHGEVHVPGRVDDVDLRVAPRHGGRGRGDGDAALLFLRHPVHHGRALVDLAHLVRLPCVIQDALGGRGLAGIDVGHDADVARVLECVLAHLLRRPFHPVHAKAPHRRRSMRGLRRITSDSGRRPCWPAPCGRCRPSS